jgi:hypothetical protein
MGLHWRNRWEDGRMGMGDVVLEEVLEVMEGALLWSGGDDGMEGGCWYDIRWDLGESRLGQM